MKFTKRRFYHEPDRNYRLQAWNDLCHNGNSAHDSCHMYSCTIIYPDWAGTYFTDKPGHIYFIISARMETRNYKLPDLPAYRTCRNPCIFRLHQRLRESCHPQQTSMGHKHPRQTSLYQRDNQTPYSLRLLLHLLCTDYG